MTGRLQEINELAALRTGEALSKLVGRPASVAFSDPQARRTEEASLTVGPEEMAAGIYLPVTGDVEGAALVIFPKEAAFILCDLLVRRPSGTTRKLSELDESALKEAGNIICGNYVAVMANMLGVRMIEHPPGFSFDMCGAITSQVVAQCAQKAEKALVVEIEFDIAPAILDGYLLLIFGMDQINAIVGSLESA